MPKNFNRKQDFPKIQTQDAVVFRGVIRADQLAEQIPTPHRFDKLIKRHGKPPIRITQIGWVKVRLPGRDGILTLVISRLAGKASVKSPKFERVQP